MTDAYAHPSRPVRMPGTPSPVTSSSCNFTCAPPDADSSGRMCLPLALTMFKVGVQQATGPPLAVSVGDSQHLLLLPVLDRALHLARSLHALSIRPAIMSRVTMTHSHWGAICSPIGCLTRPLLPAQYMLHVHLSIACYASITPP